MGEEASSESDWWVVQASTQQRTTGLNSGGGGAGDSLKLTTPSCCWCGAVISQPSPFSSLQCLSLQPFCAIRSCFPGPHNSQLADGGEDDNIHPRVDHVDQAVTVLPVEVEEAIVTVLDQYPLRPLGATPLPVTNIKSFISCSNVSNIATPLIYQKFTVCQRSVCLRSEIMKFM